MSHNDFWHIDEGGQISVASRDAKIAGTNTTPKLLNDQRSYDLEETLDLGVIYLDRQTISWDGNNFKAQSSEASRGTLVGQIVEGDGIRPKILEYKFSGKPDVNYKVRYLYDDTKNRPEWMPEAIVIRVTSPRYTSRANALFITNFIQELVLGLAQIGQSGFGYNDFIPEGATLTNANFVTYSNGIGRILVGTNYETISISGGTVILKPDRIWKIRIFMLGFLALSIIGFGWYAIRYHSTSKNGSKIKNTNEINPLPTNSD